MIDDIDVTVYIYIYYDLLRYVVLWRYCRMA